MKKINWAVLFGVAALLIHCSSTLIWSEDKVEKIQGPNFKITTTTTTATTTSYTLFNGKDLTGWQLTNCKAEVKDGAIVLVEGNGFVRTDLQYADFDLELDYLAPKAESYDAGIYFRAPFPSANPKRAWPDKYQINLKKGDETNLVGNKYAVSMGLIKENEWNHIKLSVRGNVAELKVNDKPAWKTDKIDVEIGYIGFQSEVKSGGGQFQFKNITLTEHGFTPLFNGKDLTGWIGGTNGYTVKDDKLVSLKASKENLFTEKLYDNFIFKFEFLLTPAANNGVAIWGTMEGDQSYNAIELQILDDPDPKYKDIHEWQAHGSVYGIQPAKRGFLKPVGEWNNEQVIVNGRQITVLLNGNKIVDVDLDKAAPDGKTIDDKKHPGLERKSGHIGFLGHSSEVEFRNIYVMPLKGLAHKN